MHSLCGHCSLVQLRDWRSSPWHSLPPVPGEGWVHSLLLHIEQSAPHADHLLHSLQPPSTADTHEKLKKTNRKRVSSKKLKRIHFTLILVCRKEILIRKRVEQQQATISFFFYNVKCENWLSSDATSVCKQWCTVFACEMRTTGRILCCHHVQIHSL